MKIEKNIPIPAKRVLDKKPATSTLYPFDDMKVGDSFFVDSKKTDLQVIYKRVAASVQNYQNRTNCKFTIRKLKKESGIRVWRIK